LEKRYSGKTTMSEDDVIQVHDCCGKVSQKSCWIRFGAVVM
jgi:hypothetical protein